MRFNRLFYREQDWPDLGMDLALDLEHGEISEFAFRTGDMRTHSLTAAEREKLVSLLLQCDFAHWDAEYSAPVLDGFSWHLRLDHGETTILESHGGNAFPRRWREFRKFTRFCRTLLASAQGDADGETT